MQEPKFNNKNAKIKCPRCKTVKSISIVVPDIEKGKINVEHEVFCKNIYCDARLRIAGTYIKYKKNPDGELKINKFLFNGEEKNETLYWQESN